MVVRAVIQYVVLYEVINQQIPYVRLSEWNKPAPAGWIFTKFDFSVFFENLSRKLKCN